MKMHPNGGATLAPKKNEGKNKIQPDPVPLTAKQRVAKIQRLRERTDEIETLMEESIGHWLSPECDAPRIERDRLCKELEALEALGDGGPLLTVTLDAYASTVVRRALAEGDATNAADVVNGALTYTLGLYDDHNWPEEAEKASERRVVRCEQSGVTPIVEEMRDIHPRPVHLIILELSPVQLRMLAQIMDMRDGGTMAEIVRDELGQHVALHLECHHGHDLEAARQRWDREGKAVA